MNKPNVEPAQKIASWKNRRRIAWGSFGGIILLLGVAIYRLSLGDDPNSWTGIIGIVVGILGGIVIAYTGFAAWEDVTKLKNVGDSK